MDTASGQTIMTVEDRRDVVDLLAPKLRKAGFATSTAAGGAARLQKARTENRA